MNLAEIKAKLSDPEYVLRMQERCRTHEEEERRFIAEDKERRAGMAKTLGFPEDKVDLIPMVDTAGQLFAPQVRAWVDSRLKYPCPWFFVSANSGAGKTTLLTYLGRMLLVDGKKIRYYRFSDLLDAVRKPDSELSSVDGLVVDDWWRYQWIGRAETQDQALAIVDYLYRRQKVLLIGSDKPVLRLKEETNESVSAQLFGRMRERCGRFVVQLEGKDLRQEG